MSRTYDISCKDCKKTLWIGQAGGGRETGYLYGNPKHVRALGDFLFEHKGHALDFGNSEQYEEFQEVRG